jgi:hypothetical protein
MQLRNTVLPAIKMLDPACPCSRRSSAVRRGWNKALVRFRYVKGKPRYVIGSCSGFTLSREVIVVRCCCGITIGTYPLFCLFMWRTSIIVVRFWGCAGVKRIASSTNYRSSVLQSAVCMRLGCTSSSSNWSDCIASMKSIGERRSPCLKPRMWKKCVPSPFSRTYEDEEIRRL